MQYVFNEDELKTKLRLAYRHGFSRGLVIATVDDDAQRQKQVDSADSADGFNFEAILAGSQPAGHKS